MFKHILVSTDGSKLSGKAIRAAVRLAAATGAKLTGCYVVAPYVAPMYGEAAIYLPGLSAAQYRKNGARAAKKALAAIEIEARIAGTPFVTKVVYGALPWEGILRAARSGRCDAVVMASHGRGGLGGLILGSETVRVLAHSKVPVLVVR